MDDEQLTELVEQMRRIVDYVATLGEVPAGEEAEPYQGGPQSVGLRTDEPGPVPLARPPKELAPAFRDGFFVVPRLGAMEGS